MNNRIAFVAVIASIVFLSAAPSDAAERVRPVNEGGDSQRCVTLDEFNAVYLGMPMRRAERIMDTKGHRQRPSHQLHVIADFLNITLDRSAVYKTYPVCDSDDMVVLELKNDPRKRIATAFFGVATHP
jgi:hypothetical protein